MQPSFSGLFVTWAYLPGKQHKQNINTKVGFNHICSRNQNYQLTPDDLSSLCNQAQLTDIDFYHGSFGDDAQRRVEGGGGVLLHAEDGQTERCFQLWMCDVSLFKAQTLTEPQRRHISGYLEFWFKGRHK